MANIHGISTKTTETKTNWGTGKRLDGSSSSLLTAPLASEDKYVLDAHAPSAVPNERAIFSQKWTWNPKGGENQISLKNIGILSKLNMVKWGNTGSVTDSEIHLIYLPHLPIELYRNDMMEIELHFDGAEEGEASLLSKAVFPSPLHSHIVFYPGHSFSMKPGAKFPWIINMSTSASVHESYPVADIVVYFKGYNTPLSYHTSKSGADIISLVPTSEIPTGVTLTRPRAGGDWKMKGLHYGVRSKKSIETIILLQEAGIDVEGLQMIGKLEEAVKRVGKDGMSDVPGLSEDKHTRARKIVLPLITK